jgi:predicted O-linked N-acetylglucosamine transferase (SPINDLY family)
MIDPLHFSGTNSSYDGFALDKPIVTLPARFQRGRYTLACYKMMGLSDCVVETPEAYVELAVRLACEDDFQAAISDHIRQRKAVLFEDRTAVSECERLFLEMIADAQTRST